MDGTPTFRRRRILRIFALAAALTLPASAGSPAMAGLQPNNFSASFADVGKPIEAVAPVAGAVDITSLDPAAAPDNVSAGEPLGGGMASYYADAFNGHRTASGEAFDNSELTAAHRSLPFGSHVRVTNPANGKSVVVRINDRGPFSRGRLIDLSKSAASSLGLVQRGSGRVELALVD